MRNATFWDVLHKTKQKVVNKLSRVRSTDWKSALGPHWLGHQFSHFEKSSPQPEKSTAYRSHCVFKTYSNYQVIYTFITAHAISEWSTAVLDVKLKLRVFQFLIRPRRSFLGACLHPCGDKKNTNWQEIALGELERGRNGCGEKYNPRFNSCSSKLPPVFLVYNYDPQVSEWAFWRFFLGKIMLC